MEVNYLKKPYQIPFDENGNQIDWEGWSSTEWRDNYQFEATLTYRSYGRGRSSVTFYWNDADGHSYTMFLSDLDDILSKGKLDGNCVTGRWTFVKKGSSYGVKLINE